MDDRKRLDAYWTALEANARNVNHTDRDTKPQPRKGPIPVYHFAADNHDENDTPMEWLEDGTLAWWTSADFERSFRDRYNAIVRVTTASMDLRDVIEAHTGAPAPREGDVPYNPYTDDAMLSEKEISSLARSRNDTIRRGKYVYYLLGAAAKSGAVASFQPGADNEERAQLMRVVVSGLDALPTRRWLLQRAILSMAAARIRVDTGVLNSYAL